MYYYIGTCIDNPFDSGEELEYVIDNAEPVDRRWAMDNMEIDDIAIAEMYRYPNDFEFYTSMDYARHNILYFTKGSSRKPTDFSRGRCQAWLDWNEIVSKKAKYFILMKSW